MSYTSLAQSVVDWASSKAGCVHSQAKRTQEDIFDGSSPVARACSLHGRIVGIVDSSGNLVVEYRYDACGKPTLKRTLTTAYEALSELNPFRYRGHAYDEETGLYYMRSRYYDSVWK